MRFSLGMVMVKFRLAYGFMLCVAVTLCTATDTLHFPNGDRLTGTIVEQTDTTVVFAHPVLGELTFPRGAVSVAQAEVTPQEPAPEGKPPAAAPPEEASVAEVDQGNPQPVDLSEAEPPSLPYRSVRSRQQDQESEKKLLRSDLPEGLVKLGEAAKYVREQVGKLIPDQINGRLTFGFNVRNTNTERNDFRFRGQARRRWKNLEIFISGFYEYGELYNPDNDSYRVLRDEYGTAIDARYDLIDWIFARTNLSYEQFRHRNILDDFEQEYGIGLRIYNNENLKVNFLPSGVIQYWEIRDLEGEWRHFARLGNELILTINKNLRVEQSAYYGIDPNDHDSYNYLFEASLILKLNQWVDAVASYEYDFDNFALDNRPEVDERILLSLGIPF